MRISVMYTVAFLFMALATLGVFSSHTVFAQTSTPLDLSAFSQIKNIAKWWSQGQVPDYDFVEGMQHLAQYGILHVPQTTPPNHLGPQKIPHWVRHMAGWWGEGIIGDSEFFKGMEYLVQAGIIQVNSSQQENLAESLHSQSGQSLQSSGSVPASCTARDGGILPDPSCTPGVADRGVTRDNIGSTICVSGYSSSVRPPVSYTGPLKFRLMDAYGDAGPASAYELDHLIPLEVGGSPTDVGNLWPEPRSSSYEKDGFENYLHEQVCSGDMTLQEAQREISSDWYHYWQVSKNN